MKTRWKRISASLLAAALVMAVLPTASAKALTVGIVSHEKETEAQIQNEPAGNPDSGTGEQGPSIAPAEEESKAENPAGSGQEETQPATEEPAEEESEPQIGEDETEIETEAAGETETETEIETEAETEMGTEPDLQFENEEISVKVTAKEGVELPPDTQVVIEKLSEDSEEYAKAKAAADAKTGADPETSEYSFYGMKLVADGAEFTPAEGTVSIQVELKNIVTDENPDQEILCIEETPEGKVAEEVAATAEGEKLSSVDFEI